MSRNKVPKYKKMDTEEFDNLKLMMKAGLSTKQIIAITKRSDWLVYMVRRFDSFEEYLDGIKKQREVKAEEARASTSISDPSPFKLENEQPAAPTEDYMPEVLNVLQNINAVLQSLRVQIDFIADHMMIDPDAKSKIALHHQGGTREDLEKKRRWPF